MTRREEIINVLLSQKISVQELANMFRITLDEILIDFDHIQKSYGNELKKKPAQCSGCGFVFKERSKLKTPSKCPSCRHEKIFPLRFWI